MFVRAMSTSAASADHRAKILNAALRVQMIQKMSTRGLSEMEAADEVDQAMSAAGRHRPMSAPALPMVEAFAVANPSQAPIVEGDMTVEQATSDGDPSSDASLVVALPPRRPPVLGPLPTRQSSEETLPTTIDAAATAVLVPHCPSSTGALAPVSNDIHEDLHESIQELKNMSTKELRRMVFRSASQSKMNTSASPGGGGAPVMKEEELAEVNALAATMSRREMNPDVMSRMENLTAGQQQKLTALVRKQSMVNATKEIVDMFNYIIFIVLFVSASMYGRQDDTPYKMTLNLMNQLQDKPWPARVTGVPKTFDDVDCIEELHKYLCTLSPFVRLTHMFCRAAVGNFYDVMYASGSFDGDKRFPVGATYSPRGVLGGYSEIWGPVRIGQLRVHGHPCEGTIIDKLLHNETLCYPEYSAATDSREEFRYKEFEYKADTNASSEPTFIAHSARFYPGPAFNIYLPNQESTACNYDTFEGCHVYEQLHAIEESKFFDRATRAVFIDFTVFNRNFRQLTLVRLYMEQFPSGGMDPRAELQTYQLYGYNAPADYLKLAVEVATVLVVTYQLVKEFRYRGDANTGGMAAYIHVLSLGLFYVIAALKAISYAQLPSPSQINPTVFLNFRTSAQYFWVAEAVTSIVCFLAWMKLFYFLSFIPNFAQLIKTITKAAKEMAGLMLIFFISLVGSAMAFQMSFGTRLYNFHTFWRSFLTLLQVIINKVEFEDLLETNQVLGPIFFCLFVLLMLFVILNMFIVIITDAYIEAQDEIELMHDIELNVMSKEIIDHVLHNVVFKIPLVGRHVFQPMVDLIMRFMAARAKAKSKNALVTTHEGTVSAELEAILRLKQAGTGRAKSAGLMLKAATHVEDDATSDADAAVDARLDSPPSSLQHSATAIKSIDRMAVPVNSEGSMHEEDDPADVLLQLNKTIAQEVHAYVEAMATKLADLETKADEAMVHAIQAHLDQFQLLLRT
ncbi:Aste57867_10753 [Aphanomyces stellatus]|uniref:Aste57867_10753 protein n=1 Tax=Aphanomyces stellatus TaxID=120398 RepID=A0A485KSC1_9STRA|nr:hypothetical protein As57867_010713 [Aphanomyces stellatus]VFT87623.1 Aste57867_10753 [Aphanomyces stellatus]